jgi:hypothetical protein
MEKKPPEKGGSWFVVSHPGRKNCKKQVIRFAALAQDDSGEGGAPKSRLLAPQGNKKPQGESERSIAG